MSKRHIIAEAVFDISFDSAQAAREQEPELGAFIQNRLLPLADEICSELSSDGAVSRIERLEVDLGDISYSGFRGEMESRFKANFRLALQDKIQSLAPAYSYSPSAVEGIVSEPQAEREQLEHFLETGRMARNDDHGTREASDELLERALQSSGKGLVEFLKKTPKQDIVVKRLVKQFSDQHLAAIMQLLAPAHARLLGNLVEKFGKTWKADIYGITEKEFKSLIWERLINELLKSANGASDPERFFQKTTQALFLQHAKSQNTVDGGTQPHKNGEAVHEARHQEKLPERMSQERLLAARLEAALVEGNAGEISGSWDEICRNHAGIIRETFARRMGDESARDKLAEGFPEAMLHDLIRILIPTESHFLQALANELHTAGATSARNTLMWKHALGYLHTAAGYDRSGHALSFSAYLTGQGVTQADWLSATTRPDPALGQDLSGQSHQDSLARETGQQEDIVPPNMATTGMPRAEALYQRLIQRMRSVRPEGEMAQEIEELARNHPETIERLYRRLQSGEIRANIAGLTAGEARRLAASFIGLNQGGGEAGFKHAIEAQAKSAPSEQRYYQFILEKLIGSQIVDLEEAAQCHEAIKHDEGNRRNSTPASSEVLVEPQPENEEPALEYVELLRTLLEEALVLGRVEGVVERWGELCLNHADLIRDTFIRRMGDESARDKLARGFPEAMLRDLIGILVPMEGHFIATLAKQSELHTGETGTSSDVNMALWDFTLAYLHAVELSGYERPAYVSGLIGHLAGQGLPSAFIRQAYADLSMEKRLADGDYEIALVQETGQETITPEAALGEAQDAAQESNATEEAQHRSRLEAALAGGNAFELSGIWGDLCFNHADLVRETCRRVMGEPGLRKNLAQGFPEAMLLDLIRLLAPQESRFIEALVRQPELRAGASGNHKSAPQRALWEHTLACLHGAGTRSFSRMEYTRGLTPLMAEQGMDQAKLRQAVTRIDPSLSAVLAEFVPEAETPETPKRRTERAAELYEQIKRRLGGEAWRESAPPDLAPAIEELANTYPEALARLHRQLQAGEIRANLGLLSAREARQLTAALIGLNHGGKESEFQRAIEAHAGKAQNEQRYYRHILEKLLHNQIIDLEAALSEAQDAAAEPRATEDAQTEREQHRSRLEAALAGGNASELSGIWGDLCFNHADLIRETCRRVMGEPGLRKNLAQGFPEHMLRDLVGLLAPQESGFIGTLSKQPELQAGASGNHKSAPQCALWEHTLAYLHATEEGGFSRPEYARSLISWMAGQGLERSALLQALRRTDASLEKVLAETPPESGVGETPKRRTARADELYEQLKRRLGGEALELAQHFPAASATEEAPAGREQHRSRLEAALAGGNAFELSGIWGDLCFNHADLVRETYRRVMGEPGLRKNLAQGFPEAMLLDLIRLLAPQESSFIEALVRQPELRAESTGSSTILRALLEHTLACLHGAGTRSFSRMEYTRGLTPLMVEQGMDQAKLRQAISRIDPSLSAVLAEFVPEDETPETLKRRTQRADELYEQIKRHLSGKAPQTGAPPDLAPAIEELANTYPEALARLHRQLQTGEIRANLGLLSAREARQLTAALIGLNHGGKESEFQRAIETYAKKAQNEQRYYRHILEKLLHNQIIDLEAALGEAQEAAQESSATAEAPAEREQHRSRLEAALAGGNASELSGIWGDLCFNHADLVRETYRRVMGEPGLRKNLAQGFPEAMLLDLIRLLAPQESSFIEALVRQPELRAESTGSSTILRALLEHTLAYLHGAGTRSFSRMEYTRGLTPLMAEQGMDQAKLRQAISRIDASLSAVLAEFVPEAETPETLKRQTQRAAELYEQLKRHLSGKAPQTGAPPDLAPAIEELANTYPETLARLCRQLQAGEIRVQLGLLSAREARQLTAALIGLNHGGKESEFQRAIETHAGKAQNEQRYYRHILEKLLHNQIIDLEAALSEAQEAAQESTATAEAPAEREQHRSRLEAALAGGNASELSGIWGELCFNHADLIRETYRRRMGESALRKNLAQGFPEAMLLDLIRLLAPQESSFIEALVRQPELRAESTGSSTILRALLEHTLAYLHAAGTRSFNRMEYTRGLTPLMVEQGMDQAKLRQAISRIDASLSAVLAEFVPEAETPETPKRQTARAAELYEQLKRHLSGEAQRESAPPDLAPVIEELANTYPETLARLCRQLQAGEIRANLGLLSAREARQLTAALIGLNHGGKESEFQRAIEAHAGKAQNGQRYYRHILEKLLHNQIVDLEAALGEAQENAENIHLQVKDSQPSVTAKPRPEGAKVSTPDANRRGEMEETTEEIYIANAGMVLVTPYLPQLFRMLGLTEGSKFKDERAAERAIHLLQYTVNESCDSPEFLLALNKIMCGLVTGIPIVRGIDLLPVEKETIEGMLKAIIQRWTIIGNTSVQGLRESFLQRGGRLQLGEDGWRLKVEKKGIDVLLDRLPWSISIIKHPWMALPIYVEW